MEMLEDLGAYYANEKITDEAFCKALDDLFKGSCRKWYGTNRPLATLAHQPLDLCYREQLNLLDAQRVEELSATFNKLIQETPFNHLSLAFSGDGGLHVRLKERPDLILPDPIRFAFDDHSSTNGKTFFPPPSRTAITHGDMHSGNILISKLGRTWLIDFYKTGWGPALRDFAELESNIRYDLV